MSQRDFRSGIADPCALENGHRIQWIQTEHIVDSVANVMAPS
jgi:hypothetical protein